MNYQKFCLGLSSCFLAIIFNFYQSQVSQASIESQIGKQIGKQAGKFVVNPTQIGGIIIGILVTLLLVTFIYNAVNK